MDWLDTLFGSGSDLDALQMSARGLVIFLATLVLIRVAGRRSFGQRSSFDTCIMVLLGSTLSRAVVGASPFLPTLASGAVIILLHRVAAMLALYSPICDRIVNGSPRVLFEQGRVDENQMRKGLISRPDLEEAVRKKLGESDLAKVKRVVLERNGELTVAELDGWSIPCVVAQFLRLGISSARPVIAQTQNLHTP